MRLLSFPFAEQRCKIESPELIETDGIFIACHALEEGRLPPYEQNADKFATQL